MTLARVVASSLQHPEGRVALKQALDASPYREHKLSVRSLVLKHGGSFVDQGAERLSLAPAMLRALVDSTVDLEMYMPVDQHREQWTADESLLVAFQLSEQDPVWAFDTSGNLTQLSLEAPPTIPTLVLVGRETDFERDGGRVAHAEVDCELDPEACTNDGGGGAGGSGTGNISSLLYAKNIYLENLHEPWTRGDPELEFHVTGIVSGTTVGSVSCSSKDGNVLWFPNDTRKSWDMNGHFYSDSVLVATPQDLVAGVDSAKSIELWEDDHETCETKDNSDWWTNRRGSVLSGYLVPIALLVGADCAGGPCDILTLGTALFGQPALEYWLSGQFFSDLFGGGDDHVGTLVLASKWNADHGDNVTSTHAIVLNNARVGTVDLYIVPPSP